jgi:hypothetical protein
MRKNLPLILSIALVISFFSNTASSAAQVSIRGVKPTYISGEVFGWSATAARGDSCNQTSSDPLIQLRRLDFTKFATIQVKGLASTVGEKVITIECQKSGRIVFSFVVTEGAPTVKLSATVKKEALVTSELTEIILAGTPVDRCEFYSTANANPKNFVLNKLGNYNYKVQAPTAEGSIKYSIICSRSGRAEVNFQILPRPEPSPGSTPTARHNGICKTIGDLADLPSGSKMICTPQLRSPEPIWKTITSSTRCFVEGMIVEIPNNRNPRMKCTYKNGSLVFANY